MDSASAEGRLYDVAVVGGGPAGLAVAIEATRRGLQVLLVERRAEPVDKACGEGIMPPGVRALGDLGVRSRLLPGESAEFHTVRYVDTDGTTAEGRLPAGGLAVRRVALVRAMSERARELGADLRFGCALRAHRCQERSVLLDTDDGPAAAKLLVAADGLASRLRSEAKLDRPARGPRRFGLRRHFRCRPWAGGIEVHLAHGAEAYVTPVGGDCVGIAFLWAESSLDPTAPASDGSPSGRSPGPRPSDAPEDRLAEPRWQALARLFPRLAVHLDGAVPCSRIRGAGPLAQGSLARTSHRFALVGDAAGYVDAITGEGISLSLLSSAALARVLPDAIHHGATRAALEPYEREFGRLFTRYAFATRGVLAVVRRPGLRRRVLHLLRHYPGAFDWLVARVVDA